MSRRPFLVVDELEQALCDYTGAPHTIAVDSCCNALLLGLTWWREQFGVQQIDVPRHTYVGVPIACWNAGHHVRFINEWDQSRKWWLEPTDVIDAARQLWRGMYGAGTIDCLSFSAEKHLPVGRGGAIITDNTDFAEWAVKARHDGRTPGDWTAQIVYPSFHVNMTPDVAARALWLLDHLPDRPDPLPATDYPDIEAICGEIIAAKSSSDSLAAVSDE